MITQPRSFDLEYLDSWYSFLLFSLSSTSLESAHKPELDHLDDTNLQHEKNKESEMIQRIPRQQLPIVFLLTMSLIFNLVNTHLLSKNSKIEKMKMAC